MHLTSDDIDDFISSPPAFTHPLVAVYCGASERVASHYTDSAYAFGVHLAQHGFGIVYGGGSTGMMGALAHGVADNEGVVVGVIPTFLHTREIMFTRAHTLITTDTMHTRKAAMATLASDFVTLAGGIGTLEEVFEIATWRQLAQHQKRVIVHNQDGYYDALFAQLSHMAQEGFLAHGDLAHFVKCDDLAKLCALF